MVAVQSLSIPENDVKCCKRYNKVVDVMRNIFQSIQLKDIIFICYDYFYFE